MVTLESFSVDTSVGRLWCLVRNSGIFGVSLVRPEEKKLRRRLRQKVMIEGQEQGELQGLLREELLAYFQGELREFTVPLDMVGATKFQQSVWKVARRIPYGEARSYGWIARSIKRPEAARAVGRALGSNRFLILVPCHRVILSDGHLGGFSGRPELKAWLLELEGGQMRLAFPREASPKRSGRYRISVAD